jgi:transposase
MNVADLKKELRERDHRIDELLGIVQRQSAEIEQLKKRIAELETALNHRAEANKSKKPRFSGDYSLSRQEREFSAIKKRKKSSGRRSNSEKELLVGRTEDVFPDGVPPERCCFVRDRFAWRLEDGRAVFIRYRLHKAPWSAEVAAVAELLPRSDYSLEIAVVLAHLVYCIGISIDQARSLLSFFCQLELSRSQADSLLNQLSKLWSDEFDTLAELMALATVVYMDETGWKICAKRNYAWVFTSLVHTVLLYGRTRDASILDEILPRDTFRGTAVSDDYAAYRNRFSQAQKCWAHLLRKAIKLMLAHPEKPEYREFFQELLALFRKGKQYQQDGRLGATGRKRKVVELEETFHALCLRFRPDPHIELADDTKEFANLLKELVRCLAESTLFTFVLIPDVGATNNISEQALRGDAKARQNYQTSKTEAGARRRSVIKSVLISLRQNLETFTLTSILEEVSRWRREGVSLFGRQLRELQCQRILQAHPPFG